MYCNGVHKVSHQIYVMKVCSCFYGPPDQWCSYGWLGIVV